MNEDKKTQSKSKSNIADVLREIHGLDWTPDAAYPKSGRSVRYVTTAKIKRQITPVLDKHGLHIYMTMADPPALEGTCALVQYNMCITDGEEEYIPATIYAEGNNDPGKRILTSMTNAYRIYTLMAFSIIDGMEDEAPTASEPV